MKAKPGILTLAQSIVLEFEVRDPISTNAGYKRSGRTAGRKGLFATPEMRDFKHRVREFARLVRAGSEWPTELFAPAHVRVSYDLYDYRGDSDGVRKPIKDAMQGVLYHDDKVASDGLAPLPVADGQGRRVRIHVELLAVYDAPTIARRRREHDARQMRKFSLNVAPKTRKKAA